MLAESGAPLALGPCNPLPIWLRPFSTEASDIGSITLAGAPAVDALVAEDEELPAFLEEATEGPDYPAAAE